MKKLLVGFCLVVLPFSLTWAGIIDPPASLLQGAVVYSPKDISKYDWLQGYDGSKPCGSCSGSPSVSGGACGIDTRTSTFQFRINTNGDSTCNNFVVWQCAPPSNRKNKPVNLSGAAPCSFSGAPYAKGIACGGSDNQNPDKSCKQPFVGQYQYIESTTPPTPPGGKLNKVTVIK